MPSDAKKAAAEIIGALGMEKNVYRSEPVTITNWFYGPPKHPIPRGPLSPMERLQNRWAIKAVAEAMITMAEKLPKVHRGDACQPTSP